MRCHCNEDDRNHTKHAALFVDPESHFQQHAATRHETPPADQLHCNLHVLLLPGPRDQKRQNATEQIIEAADKKLKKRKTEITTNNEDNEESSLSYTENQNKRTTTGNTSMTKVTPI